MLKPAPISPNFEINKIFRNILIDAVKIIEIPIILDLFCKIKIKE